MLEEDTSKVNFEASILNYKIIRFCGSAFFLTKHFEVNKNDWNYHRWGSFTAVEEVFPVDCNRRRFDNQRRKTIPSDPYYSLFPKKYNILVASYNFLSSS